MESSPQEGNWSDRVKRMSDEEILKLNLHHMSAKDAERFGLTERFNQMKAREASVKRPGRTIENISRWLKRLLDAFAGDDGRGHPKKPTRNSGKSAA